jgi:hypothetical protein
MFNVWNHPLIMVRAVCNQRGQCWKHWHVAYTRRQGCWHVDPPANELEKRDQRELMRLPFISFSITIVRINTTLWERSMRGKFWILTCFLFLSIAGWWLDQKLLGPNPKMGFLPPVIIVVVSKWRRERKYIEALLCFLVRSYHTVVDR